jgi:ABC-type phosphate transport system substrate-binding protein
MILHHMSTAPHGSTIRTGRGRAMPMRWLAVVLGVYLLAARTATTGAEASIQKYEHGHVMLDPSLRIRVGVTGSSKLWLAKATQAYGMRRSDVAFDIITSTISTTAAATRVALAQLLRGETDVAFLPMTLTAAERKAGPDLLYLPFWATAFAPIYNLPTTEVGNDLILTLPVLAQIFVGNITKSVQRFTKARNLSESTAARDRILTPFLGFCVSF